MSYRFTNVGRSFFPLPRITPVDLGEGMELWKGFFQSPVMGWKPFLNIDGKYLSNTFKIFQFSFLIWFMMYLR